MPAEQSRDVKFEIGHVLFIDIVGYSKLLINEQSEQIQKLKEVVRGAEQFRLAEAEGKLLRLPTGDGGALVFRTSPEAPVRCALEITEALQKHPGSKEKPQLRLRMGIHSGPVNEITDLNEQANIAGAGINIAQRIMDCGDAGHILLSKRVADDLEQYPQWRPLLHELGECEVKHGARVSVVNLYSDKWGNAKLPERFNPRRDGMKAAASADASAGKLNAMRWAGIAAMILVLTGIGAWFFRFQSSTKQPAHPVGASSMASPGPSVAEKSIAVLPFENASGNADTEYLSDGISEALINSLTDLQQLRVIARSTAFRYKGKQVDPQRVGRELKVRTVLTGVIRQLGERLDVQVDLVDTATGAQLWGQEYERKLADVVAVKQALVREVTEKFKLGLTGEEQRQLTKHDTTNPEAYQFYLRGRYYWNKRTAENVKKAGDQFQWAAEKDPNYALAYVGLADCSLLQEDYVGMPGSETYAKAERFAQRALELDRSLAEANASLGFIYTGMWQWERAEQEFKRSKTLNPNYATASHWYGLYLLDVGRTDEALDELKRAHEMDPLAAVIETSLTYAYFAKGDLDGAIAECKRVVELDPNYPRAREYLGLGYLKQERYAEAMAELQKAVELSGRERRPLRDLGYGFAISGKRVEAFAVLKELQAKYEKHEAIGQDLAAVCAGLGDKDEAFAWLEKDFQARSGLLAWIRWTPPFESLRGDPRQADLLRRMGLKP